MVEYEELGLKKKMKTMVMYGMRKAMKIQRKR